MKRFSFGKYAAAAAMSAAKQAYKRRSSKPKSKGKPRASTSTKKLARRGRSRTVTRRTRGGNTDPDGSMVYSRLTRNFGRPARYTIKNAITAIRRSEKPITFITRFLTPFASAGGGIALNSYEGGTPFVGWYPVHLYDLTSCNNQQNNSVLTHVPGVFLWRDSTAPAGTQQCRWQSLRSQLPSTGAVEISRWHLDQSETPNNYIDTFPNQSSTMKWVDIKLMCHGATNVPTKYRIELVQINRDYVPRPQGGLMYDQPGLPSDYDEFWHYMARPYTASPFAMEGSHHRKHYRVVHSIDFTLQPRDADIGGTVTPFKEVKIFKHLNRHCRYDWEKFSSSAGLLDNDDFRMPLYDAENQTTVHPSKRLFLMIRATTVTVTTPPAEFFEGGAGGSTIPTYDYSIRTRHIVNQ